MGEFQDFLSKFFCLTVPKISAGWELFSVLLISGIEKVWLRGGKYQDFLYKICCFTVPENFVREPFCAVFQKNSGCEKIYE